MTYADFIDIYAALDENERQVYSQRYPREAAKMTGFAKRFIEQGLQRGRQEGEATMLLRLIILKFGEPDERLRRSIESADAETLLHCSERILTADTLDDVLE